MIISFKKLIKWKQSTGCEELARQNLLNLSQSNQPLQKYVAEFRKLSNELNSSDSELCFLFKKGLSPGLLSFLAHHLLPDTIDNLII